MNPSTSADFCRLAGCPGARHFTLQQNVQAMTLMCPAYGNSSHHPTRCILCVGAGIPPSMHHHWDYNPASADEEGCIRYLMVAFSHSFVRHCMDTFPELRNRLANVTFPAEALKSPFRAGIYERKRRFAGKIQKVTIRCDNIFAVRLIFS